MDKKAYEIRIREWMGILQAASESSLSKTEWCKQNGISKRKYYYWQRKVQDHLIENGMVPENSISPIPAGSSSLMERPVFCEISEPASASGPALCSSEQRAADFRAEAVISCGSISILINEDTSEKTLGKVLSVLRNCP